MAKNDNLKDFLTDVANAIREKKGTTDLINPQDFSAEIASIETGGGGEGGGGAVVTAKDVNFRDYDGTILHSYTKAQFLALSELPELPTRQGLICQEWTYNYADAQSYVSKYGKLDIGATYITDDGKTRLYLTILEKGRMEVPLHFHQDIANGVVIDWGDGSATQTLSGTGTKNTSHTYAEEGNYVISLMPTNGCTLKLGGGSSSLCVLGDTSTSPGGGGVYRSMLTAVEVGSNTIIRDYAFFNCMALARITIPKGSTYIAAAVFKYCHSLSCVVVPKGVTTLWGEAFYGCYSLSCIVVPKGVTTIKSSAIYYCESISRVVIPEGVTLEKYFCYECSSLSCVVIPENVKLPQYTCWDCLSLPMVVINKGVSIENYSFNRCYSLAILDCRKCTSVPTLGGSSCFSNAPTDLKIVVPDALYDTWIAATNWSSHASNIVKASEYTE